LLRQKKTVRGKQSDNTSFLLRLFAGVFLCVLIIPLSMVLMLHIPAVQKSLFQKAVEKLATSEGIEIQLESFSWSPLREVRLFNLKVTSSGENVLLCEEAKLGYHLSLHWPYLHPDELSLEKPWLRLERDAQGHWRLPATKSQGAGNARGSKPFPWSSFPWPQVRIISGNIVAYQDGQTVLSVRDVNATLSFEEVLGADGPRLKINFGQWQGCAEIPELGEWELTGEAEIKGQTLSVAQLKLNVPKMAQLYSRGRWDLISPFDGALEIQIMQLSTADLPALGKKFPQLKEITGSLLLGRESGIWSLDHDLKSNLGNLQGTLRLESTSVNDRAIHLLSRFANLQVPIPSKSSESHLFGQLEVTVEGTRLQNAQARLHAVLETSRWGDQTIQKGELTGTYQNGMLEIKAPKIQSSMGDLDFSVNADLNGLWDFDRQGQVKLGLRTERASLEKIYSGATQQFGGSIVYEGRYGPGDFARWERWQGKMEANLSLPQLLTLKASGNQKSDSLTLDYDLEVTEIQRFAAFFPSWRGKGKVTSRGSIKGRWPDLVWEGVVSSPLLQFGAIQAEQASLKGKGRIIGKEAQRDLTLKVKQLSADGKKFGSLNLDLQQEADACRFDIRSEGVWNEGNARLSGRLEKVWGPVRMLLVTQSTLGWKNQSASLDGKIEVGHDGIRVQSLNIHHGKEKVQLAGEVFFDAKTDLKLTFDGIDVGQWLQLVFSGKQVSGVASGQVYLKGRTDQPEASLTMHLLNGAVMVPKKAAAGPESSRQSKPSTHEALIERLQLQGTLVRDILNVQGDLQSPTVQNPVRFSAKIPMHLSLKPPRLEVKSSEEWAFSGKIVGFQAEGVLPYLAFLEKLGGRIDLDAQGGGTMSHPLIAAGGSWRDGSLKLKKWPYPIENIQIDWRADAREITLSKGAVELLGGHVNVKGRVSYPWFQEMDIEATGTDLDVKDIYGVKGKTSGRAQLTKTATATKLIGELNLSKAEMNLGRLETDLARNIRVIDGDGKEDVLEVHKDAAEQNSFVEKLEMDLTINLPPSGTWVRGMGLEAEIAGTLKIEKRPFAPVKLRGGFQTLRGEYKFQDYRLKIVEGELIFPEALQPEPHLRIVCQKDVKDVIIQAHVTGPLKQPKLVLSSIPSMNQVDILSYLLFDRAAGDLSSKESFQLQDRAASWLGSQTSQLLKKVIGNTLLTPDTIEYRKSTIKATGTTGNKSDVGVVAIGKYITPDLYVNFEKGVTGEEGNQVNVEYRLNRHFSIQTEFGGTQQSGIDLFWRYDFGK
jgi:autotransporter translocation and assembly factor TamB